MPIKVAASQQRYPHRLEVSRTRVIAHGKRQLAVRRFGPLGYIEVELAVASAERKQVGGGRGLNSGQTSDPVEQVSEEIGCLCLVGICCWRQSHVHRHDVLGIKAGTHL